MRRGVVVTIALIAVLGLTGLGVGLYFVFRTTEETPDEPPTTQIPHRKGAVATSADECTDIAVNILKIGGSAVDSAISATLCQGLVVSQSSGLGGGLVATVYIKETGEFETLNSRETAPAAAFKDMYATNLESYDGGLAIAVPGELKGLFELHKKYGVLKWSEVVQPVIDVAERGYKVNKYLGEILVDRQAKIKSRPLIRCEQKKHFVQKLINLLVLEICLPILRQANCILKVTL